MDINKTFLIELERETASTRQLLERLQDEHFSYRPHPKSMTLGELASHVVELHNWVKVALSVEVFDFHTMYKPLAGQSTNELIEILNAGYDGNVAVIAGMTEEGWKEMWTLQAGSHIIAQVPRLGAFRFIIKNHLIHHRGQLTVYMRMLDIPLPGLYGPSADEK